jgi:ankyrin repeat protein
MREFCEMAKKKKLLPKDFKERLEKGAPLEELVAVFETCELDARVDRGGTSALGLYDCPEDLARWLVAQGADVEFHDQFRSPPLSQHVSVGNHHMVSVLIELGTDIAKYNVLYWAIRAGNPETFKLLINHGADILSSTDDYEGSLLSYALATSHRSHRVPATAEMVELLVNAG